MAGNRRRTTWKDLVWLVFIFEIAVVVHGFTGSFLKQITIYRDEWLYYSMADSLWNHQSLAVQGADIDFQKIGYSLVLSPLFAISDSLLRVRVMGWLNSVMAMSAIFPVWLIGKELGLRKKERYLAAVVYCFVPETLLSMTFMAENLYWPLALWCVWLHMVNNRRKYWYIALVEGVLGCFTYFVKEAYLAFSASLIIMDLAEFVRNRRCGEKGSSRGILCLIVYIITMGGLFTAVRWGVLADMAYSYSNQVNVTLQADWGQAVFLGKTILYYLGATLGATMVMPILLPLIYRNKMDERGKRCTDTALLYLGITILFIAYSVCLPYEYGESIPRLHLRYYAPALILLFIAMLACVQKNQEENSNKIFRRRVIFYSVASFLLVTVCYTGNRYGSVVDQMSMAWVDAMQWVLGKNGKAGIWRIVFCAIMALEVGGSGLLIWRGKIKVTLRIYLGMLLVITICNWTEVVPRLQRDYLADEGLVSQVQLINKALAEVGDDSKVMLLADRDADMETRGCLDTYLTVPGELSAPVASAVEWGFDSPVIWTDGADYLVVSGEQLLSGYVFESCDDLTPAGVTDLRLYRCFNSEMISLRSEDGYEVSEVPMEIWFCGDAYNAPAFVKRGIYDPEQDFSWTKGSKMRFEIPTDGTVGTVRVEMEIAGTINGDQRFEVVQNRETVFEGVAAGAGVYHFYLDSDGYDLQFTIELPDAVDIIDVYPESGDGRTVALQMQRMKLWIVK